MRIITTAVRRRSRLVTPVLVILTVFVLAPSLVPAQSTAAAPYDRFLFVRNDPAKGKALPEQTLVMAKITPYGIKTEDLWSEFNLGVGMKMLGVYGGRAYLLMIRDLVCVDLKSGRVTRIAQNLQLPAYVNGVLYRAEGGNIRQYDFRRRAYRHVMSIPDAPYSLRLAVSPDRKHLAFFLPETDRSNGPCQLYVVDPERHKAEKLGLPVRWQDSFTASGIEVTPPLEWLDARRLLFIRTDFGDDGLPPANLAEGLDARRLRSIGTGFGPGLPQADLAAVADIDARTITDIVRLPSERMPGGARVNRRRGLIP